MDAVYPPFERAIRELEKLNHYQVLIGYFGERNGTLLTIVRANEYGAHIVPKKGEYLYVPSVDAKGKKIVYKLKEVDIPARAFMRNALQNNKAKYAKILDEGVKDIVEGNTTAMKLLNHLGSVATADIVKSSIDLKKPANAPLTIANKKSDNPLVDTGELQRKATWKVVPL